MPQSASEGDGNGSRLARVLESSFSDGKGEPVPNHGERRSGARYRIPTVVDVPGLSDIPIVPEDVSSRGFCVMASKKPRVGDSVPFSIQIADEVFDRCEARVIWIKKKAEIPHRWSVGLVVEKGDAGRMGAALERISTQMGGLMSPMPW